MTQLGGRFEQALLYAAHVHGGHVRKGTTIPYLAHLLAVAALVLEDDGDEDDAIAA
jgi:(p)ppGpp synthase/HD superfamily hydrolase